MKQKKAWMAVVIGMLVLGVVLYTRAEPIGPGILYNDTEEPGMPTSPTMMNDTKGRITTVEFNATQPDEDWKGYVGNVTGKLTLDDTENYTLFDWSFSVIQGEVYATRGDTVAWSTVGCADITDINGEETALNHISTQADRINETFDNNTHPEFYTADTQFSANQCDFAVYTYVNDRLQGRHFPEVLLYDSTNSNLIYTALLNDSTSGFDTKKYDFQMIVSEDSSRVANLAYYFYVEVG